MLTGDCNKFLAKVSGKPIKIIPYLGPYDFDNWYELQSPYVIS